MSMGHMHDASCRSQPVKATPTHFVRLSKGGGAEQLMFVSCDLRHYAGIACATWHIRGISRRLMDLYRHTYSGQTTSSSSGQTHRGEPQRVYTPRPGLRIVAKSIPCNAEKDVSLYTIDHLSSVCFLPWLLRYACIAMASSICIFFSRCPYMTPSAQRQTTPIGGDTFSFFSPRGLIGRARWVDCCEVSADGRKTIVKIGLSKVRSVHASAVLGLSSGCPRSD